MIRRTDLLTQRILKHLIRLQEPLETKEIESFFPTETRTKILYRLNQLRGDGKIKGKAIGSGKGTWIWWYSTPNQTQQIPPYHSSHQLLSPQHPNQKQRKDLDEEEQYES